MTRAAAAPSARLVAARTLVRAVRDDAYVDRAFRAEAAGLAPREHGLARALAYAAVQRRATLAYWIEVLAGRPASSLDEEVRIPLELGLVQLGLMDRIPPHAAVSESVDIAKRLSNRGGDRLVNAVLRRASSDGLPPLPATTRPRPQRSPTRCRAGSPNAGSRTTGRARRASCWPASTSRPNAPFA